MVGEASENTRKLGQKAVFYCLLDILIVNTEANKVRTELSS